MGKRRFRFAVPNSWLNILREMAKPRKVGNRAIPSKQSDEDILTSPNLQKIPPNSQNYAPNRPSQYLQSKERLDILSKLPSQQIKPKSKSKPTSPVRLVRKSSHDITPEGPTSQELNLRPILTKQRNRGKKIKVSSISPRCNSRDKKRRFLSESSLEVMYSTNPEKDFMDSVMEMIVEKNIVKLKDLEDLLACYLSLNSREQHNVIVKVFEKIWIVLVQANYVS